MKTRVINLEMVRKAEHNLERIAKEHPELTHLSGDDTKRLLQGVFNVTVDKDKLTFKLSEAAEILGLSTATLSRAIKAGKLKAMKTGREYIVSRSDLQDYYSSNGGGNLF